MYCLHLSASSPTQSAGFLFYFEKRGDVRGAHVIGSAREMPDFVLVLIFVASVDDFLQFGGRPGAHYTALRVTATITSFRQRFMLFLFHTGSGKWKGECTSTAVG